MVRDTAKQLQQHKPLLGHRFCELPFRTSPPDVEASGKNDSTVWWVWFITKDDQRQAAGGGARRVKSQGKEKDQKKALKDGHPAFL